MDAVERWSRGRLPGVSPALGHGPIPKVPLGVSFEAGRPLSPPTPPPPPPPRFCMCVCRRYVLASGEEGGNREFMKEDESDN